ncbi:F-box FBD LRR-repeat At1g13570-like isoform X1 [Olea europaea subsp. europaea]|uniref:F-box FBD LRR-repeat At1g13570-like isoform X1 n=1 Tax=Olea europaea subsp. europaea TaxID=158383 RepID=A0A8S0PJG4_OLEEU|nr:F-box FBD LRR-repeat At1g13570-like isoform X1 [Olea europaea subsp. europaea]
MDNMKQREPPKVPSCVGMEVDKISNLPEHIIDNILSSLPLRDAVRTSILSSKWRFKWVTLPHLVFENQSVLISAQDQTIIKNKLVSVIDHVLLLHTGPIYRFKLSHRDLQGVSDVDRWILFLSRGFVKEFILEIWKGHRYKLPSSMYSFQKLIHLELFNCLLKPPYTFNGFKSLKSLDLQHITMDQGAFEDMVSNCPLLERLTLMNFDGFTHLKIHAPNLVFFDVGGVFEEVDFHDTINLAIVSIGLYSNTGSDRNMAFGCTGNLIKFFANLPRIQRLEVQNFFLKYLAAGGVPVKLPTPCIVLTFLSIRVNFNDMEEDLAALCLLRSCPNLQELELFARSEEHATMRSVSNTVENYQCLPLNQLRLVKIVGISGIKQELSFINFLLANSPVLEKMTVKPASMEGGMEMAKELLRFRRASSQAEIIYLDGVQD